MADIEKKAGIIKQLADTFPKTAMHTDIALSTTVRAINAALVTIKPAIWGFERIGEWLDKKLPEKLKDVPEENIITPPINIAGPAIEAMRFTGENDELREMYVNLLAASMDKRTSNNVFPRFVEITKNLTTKDAIILKCFSELSSIFNYCANKYRISDNYNKKEITFYSFEYKLLIERVREEYEAFTHDDIAISIENILHLGLLFEDNIRKRMSNRDELEKLIKVISDKHIHSVLTNIKKDNRFIHYTTSKIKITSIGHLFFEHVIKSK